MTATVVFCVTGWILGWVVFGRPRVLAPSADVIDDGPAPEPPVDQRRAIIVPARNEAHHIGGLLQDLTAATAIEAADSPGAAPTSLIIVVDDHSSDDTAAIAAAVEGVVVVAAPDLPNGWTGKSWACWNGVTAALQRFDVTPAASGDLQLVFIDADVNMSPGALDAVTKVA